MRLLTVITPHGYGHAAQVLVVLNALMERVPDTDLHIATTVPKAFLETRLPHPFTYHSHATDFGMKMNSALDIDLDASAGAYASQAGLWDSLVEAEIGFLTAVKPDRLLADIPYIPLAAADKLGLPTIALCSLNWAGIYRHYFDVRPEAGDVLKRLVAAYNSAGVFLTPEPFMPMPELTNTRVIGPLTRRGRRRRDEINRQLNLKGDEKLVLIALGGVQGRLPMEQWPQTPGVHWLVQQSWGVERTDCHNLESLEMPFIDLLASCDVLLGKIGYGTVTECAVNGIPMLYIPRADWPEEPCLVDWLRECGVVECLERAQAERGEFIDLLQAVLRRPVTGLTAETGEQTAVDCILEPPG